MRTGLQSGLFMHMKMGHRAVIRMSAEQMAMSATGPAELTINVKEPKEEQRSSSDPGKPGTDLFVKRDSEPGNKHAQKSGEKHVTRPGQSRYADRLLLVPALRPGRDDKRQPVRRNGRVKKSDAESGKSDRSKNRFVHARKNR